MSLAQGLQATPQHRRRLANTIEESFRGKLLEYRMADRGHQGVAAIRAALIAGFETADVFPCEQCRQRGSRADPLAERQDIRPNAGVLEAEESAGASHAGLDLVQDEQDPPLVGQRAQ